MARRITPSLRSIRKRSLPVGITICIAIGIAAVMFIGFLWIGMPSSQPGNLKAGVTFSVPYAEELRLNWRETLTAALDDLGIRLFRIPAYWSLIESKEGTYDWGTLDYQMDEIATRNGKVILAVGAKLPRWPECWIPEWAIRKGLAGEREARLQYIEQVVLRYRDHKALAMWQVENEPIFDFGLCPKPYYAFLKQEIALVQRLDIHHPVATTDSGELSDWIRAGSLVDHLGVSTYRVVKTFWGATWDYTFIPPYWYARRAALLHVFIKDIYVSEFQMEPWSDHSLVDTPIGQQLSFFSPDRMQNHFAYAERMGLDSVSFWGVEWWYWMKTQQHDPRFWSLAKQFFARHANDNVQFP